MKLRNKHTLKICVAAAMLAISSCILAGCSSTPSSSSQTAQTMNQEEKVFHYGTTAYSYDNGIDPHVGYAGWSTIRYGVGETLFRFTESMELEPWLATGYEQLDDYTMKISLRDDVTFHNGKKMTGESVKKCLERLVETHDRAPTDLNIESITAQGQTVTIKSKNKVTTLLNYLADPYGCIIDVDEELHNGVCIGTGPYKGVSANDESLFLEAYDGYYGGKAKVGKVEVSRITDGDTLTMALQNGEIDATQGLPYSSYNLFEENDQFKISSADTSRVYQVAFNFDTPVLQDLKVRQAICSAIDKDAFCKTLLNGRGTPAVGAFPSNFEFGNNALTGPSFDKEKSKSLLAEAGWIDTDGDGYVDKNGQKLTIRWLTYSSRQELPLLAEYAESNLKDIGIEVQINVTENAKNVLASGQYDVYASAFVTAPTGDPQYFFTAHLLDESPYNAGHCHSDKVEGLVGELRNEFDTEKRAQLAIEIQQQVLDDSAYLFVSHLKMSFVMQKSISGFEAHPSDYYEITNHLDVN